MRKLAAIMMALFATMALAACASGTLSVESDDTGVHAVAQNGGEGSATGNITVEDGCGLCINHAVSRGSFHVRVVDALGMAVYDEDITADGADLVEASGDFDIVVSASGAEGAIDIIPYEIEMQAAGASSSIANPWAEADSADAAAKGAGVGTFELPAEDIEIEGGPVGFLGYRYMDELAEADGYAGAAELTIRKGVSSQDQEGHDADDVSGDWNSYMFEWDLEAGDRQVTCFGNEEGRAMKAVWQADGYSYCILIRGQGDMRDTYGLADDAIVALAGAIG